MRKFFKFIKMNGIQYESMSSRLDEFMEIASANIIQKISPRLIALVIEFANLWKSGRDNAQEIAIDTIEYESDVLGFGAPLVKAIGECFNFDANEEFDIKRFFDRYAPRGTKDEFVKRSKLYFAIRTHDERFHVYDNDIIDEYNSKIKEPANIIDFWLNILQSEVASKLLNISRVIRLNYATIYVVFKNNNRLELCADKYLYILSGVIEFHLLEYPKINANETTIEPTIEFAKKFSTIEGKLIEVDTLGIYARRSGSHITREKGHLSISEEFGSYNCLICGENDKSGCSCGEFTTEIGKFHELIIRTICETSKEIENFTYSIERWPKPKKYKLVDGFFERIELTYDLTPEIDRFRSWLWEITSMTHHKRDHKMRDIKFKFKSHEFTVEIENSIFPYYDGIYEDCVDFEIPREFKFINNLSINENGNLEIRTRTEKARFRELIVGNKAGKFFKNLFSISNSFESNGNIELVCSQSRLREFKEFMRKHNKLDIPNEVYSGCYLIQTNGDRGSNKYKIGKASNLMKRLKTCEGYKNALIIQAEFVRDPNACEREIIEVFSNEFELVKYDIKGNYGSEYFRGDYVKIRRRFQEICEKYW